jgi:imidazolonepropionase-like amidohydrolase
MRAVKAALHVLAVVALIGASLCAADAQATTYVIKAARLFDSVSGTVVEPGLIVVAEGRIVSVGARSDPPGATVIDLGDATLLPGFIDSHTHLSQEFNANYHGAMLPGMQRTVAETAIRATANARKTLLAGFTTVRDVGGSDFMDVGLRNAINAG